MKKAWGYIATFFMGVSAMAIIALKYFSGDDYKAYISKVKSKGESTQDVVFKPIVGTSDKSNGKLQSDKKAAKIARKNERKKKRALKRLNTNIN